jgi:hypothetical protein
MHKSQGLRTGRVIRKYKSTVQCQAFFINCDVLPSN